MLRVHRYESEGIDGADQPTLDTSSPARFGAGHSVDPPYRDRHDALVHRRRALSREHDEASRAAARRDRLARQLAVIDEQLRDEARPLLASLPVARRCRSKWEQMSGTDSCRRCVRCGHDVHDVARMTRDEADALVARLGGRMRRRPDGRVASAECPAERPGLGARLATGGLAGAVAGGVMALAFGPPLELLVQLAGARSARAAVVEPPPPPTVVRVEALRSGLDRTAPPGDAVRLLGPGTYELDRASLAELASMERAIRVAPDPHRGGLRLHGLRRDTLLHALGVRNGDVILDVNGLPLAYPDQALEAWARLRDRDLFVVRLVRRGEERVHVYHVRSTS